MASYMWYFCPKCIILKKLDKPQLRVITVQNNWSGLFKSIIVTKDRGKLRSCARAEGLQGNETTKCSMRSLQQVKNINWTVAKFDKVYKLVNSIIYQC